MSSEGSRKAGPKPGKFRVGRASNKFRVPSGKGKTAAGDEAPSSKPASESTEEIPEDELLDEEDLEEIDPGDALEDDEGEDDDLDDGVEYGEGEVTAADAKEGDEEDKGEVSEDASKIAARSQATPNPEPSRLSAPADIVTGEVIVGAGKPKTKKKPRPSSVDPFAATQSLSREQIRAAGISETPLARPAPSKPNPPGDERSDAAAAAAAIAGLGDGETIETSFVGAPPAPPGSSSSGSFPSMPPSASGPFPMVGAPPGPSSSGPFPAMSTPPPGAVDPMSTPVPFPAPGGYGPAPAPPPRPGSTEAAREASWKQAHPSARRWARRRRSHGPMAGRRTPHPLRIGLGLMLVGVGIYLLAIFIPAHDPTGMHESSTGQVSKAWRFSEGGHSAAAAFGFGFVALGLFGIGRGVAYRRFAEVPCRRCQMPVEASREGVVYKCPNGNHIAAPQILSLVFVGGFVILTISTIALFLIASLG